MRVGGSVKLRNKFLSPKLVNVAVGWTEDGDNFPFFTYHDEDKNESSCTGVTLHVFF